MKLTQSLVPTVIILSAFIALQACKAKKPVVQLPSPAATNSPAMPPPAPEPPKPAPAEEPKMGAPAPVEKPNYNFKNIQFEYNSGILKTASYPILDKAASEMKKDPSVKFSLSGYASAEGTADHNMTLSVDRANAVKAYLVNSGISSASLSTNGYGESNPVADNTTEAGKVLNRRVEIKKAK